MKPRLWPSAETRGLLRLRALMRLGVRTTFHGVEVIVPDETEHAGQVQLEKIVTALELIHTYDPGRFSRLRRDIPVVLSAGDASMRGRYVVRLRMCELHFRWLLEEETTASEVATVLAHEAMHGQLYRIGVGYRREWRIRIERLCCQASIALGRKLPGGARHVLSARRMQAHAEWVWSAEVAFELHRKVQTQAIHELREAGVPRWIIRLVEAHARRVNASHARALNAPAKP